MKKCFLLSLALIAMTLPVSRSNAQTADVAPRADSQSTFATAPSVSIVQGVASPSPLAQSFRYVYGRDPQQMARFQEAMNAYKKAESGSDKEAAKKEIHGLLAEQYDKSLGRYEEHLNELEKKIAEMRDQLERRRKAKDAVVDLKLDMVISEADGLGWPDEGGANNLFFPGAVNGWGALPGQLSAPIAPVVEVPGIPVQPAIHGNSAR